MAASSLRNRCRPTSAPASRRPPQLDELSITGTSLNKPSTPTQLPQTNAQGMAWQSLGSSEASATSPAAVPTSSQRMRPKSAPLGGRPLETSERAIGSSAGASQGASMRSGIGSYSGINLRDVHYASMRRAADIRARQQEEREAEVDRHMDGARRPRPQSAPAFRRTASAPAWAKDSGGQPEVQQPSEPTSPTNPCAGYKEASSPKMGDFHSFVQSGQYGLAKRPSCTSGYPNRLRRPFTSIPGYTGYVPRKLSDGILGCTYNRANMISREMVLGHRFPAR